MRKKDFSLRSKSQLIYKVAGPRPKKSPRLRLSNRAHLNLIQSDPIANRNHSVAQDCGFQPAAMVQRLENPRELRDLYQMTARLKQTDAAHPDVSDHELSVQQIDQGNTASDNIAASFLRDRFQPELFRGELEHLVFDEAHGFIGPIDGVPGLPKEAIAF